MAAVAYDTHDRRSTRPALRLVPTAKRSRPSVYRRRRVLALAVLATTFVLVGLLVVPAVRAGLGVLGGSPLTPAGSPTAPALRSVAAQIYVVQQGDTIWSIARRLQPSGDVRPLVDRLAGAHGHGPLIPGERLPLP